VKSRFSRIIRWRLPRHRRSVRLSGAEEDTGRYLKCWNCGFLIDTQLGLSGTDGNGNSYSQPGTNDTISKNVVTSYEAYNIDTAISCCPLCGTANLP
jgi:hypothetical protein